ncbi:hypothetical protein ALC53_04349 [Atta colombica]|uniref:Odorant receptor n=1 Tax=Atta colombica TaxID=520822 RepID=A0A151I4I7_9HYME|nr:hypothetical protein ALC53_04349 [Atta colombica]
MKNVVTTTLRPMENPLKFYWLSGWLGVFVWACLPFLLIFKEISFFYEDYRMPAVFSKQPFSLDVFLLGSVFILIGNMYVFVKKVGMDVYMIHLVLLITAQYRYIAIKLAVIFRDGNSLNKLNESHQKYCSGINHWVKKEMITLCRHHNNIVHLSSMLKKLLSLNFSMIYVNSVLRFCFIGIMLSTEGRVELLPTTKEKYMLFTKYVDSIKNNQKNCMKLRFIDSFLSKDKLRILQCEFLNLSEKNCNLLTRKDISPYEHTDCVEKLDANNKYMSYDLFKSSSYLIYYDINNLYWVDVQNFDFITITLNSSIDYILEVDVEYPQHLHDAHIDLRSQYTRYDLRTAKIHRILQFAQSPWLCDYIEINIKFRILTKNDFEKNLYKLMNNAVFGKPWRTMRINMRIFTKREGRYGIPSTTVLEALSIVMFACGSIVQFYILCSCVQQLLDASQQMTNKAFHEKWYQFGPSVKRTFMLMILGNNLECKLSMCDKFNLSLPSFMIVRVYFIFLQGVIEHNLF